MLGDDRRCRALFLQGRWRLQAQLAHQLPNALAPDGSMLLTQRLVDPTVPRSVAPPLLLGPRPPRTCAPWPAGVVAR